MWMIVVKRLPSFQMGDATHLFIEVIIDGQKKVSNHVSEGTWERSVVKHNVDGKMARSQLQFSNLDIGKSKRNGEITLHGH